MVRIDVHPVEVLVRKPNVATRRFDSMDLNRWDFPETFVHSRADRVHGGLTRGSTASPPAIGEVGVESPRIDEVKLSRSRDAQDRFAEVALPDTNLGANGVDRESAEESLATTSVMDPPAEPRDDLHQFRDASTTVAETAFSSWKTSRTAVTSTMLDVLRKTPKRGFPVCMLLIQSSSNAIHW